MIKKTSNKRKTKSCKKQSNGTQKKRIREVTTTNKQTQHEQNKQKKTPMQHQNKTKQT